MKQIASMKGEERGEFAASFVGKEVSLTCKRVDDEFVGRVIAVAAAMGGHTDYVLVLYTPTKRVLAFPLATLRRIEIVRDPQLDNGG